MNRSNGEYKVLAWETSSRMKAHLTPSYVLCFLQKNLLSSSYPPSNWFLLKLPQIFSRTPLQPLLLHFLAFLPFLCFCLLLEATVRSTAHFLGRMSSPSTTTMVSHALSHMSMQLVLGRKGSPHFKKWKKNNSPWWCPQRGLHQCIKSCLIWILFVLWKKT